MCALGLGLAACGGETEDRGLRDAGATVDAGAQTDASAGLDAAADPDATAGADAGPEADAGPAADAGEMDAGEADAGTIPTGPIAAPADTWTWVDFPSSRCIDGSPTGIGVNLHPGATKAIILLMGGNACFNQASCFTTANLDGYGATKFANEVGQLSSTPLFDRSSNSNIFADYHYVYVPYCTGDVHAGNNPNGSVAGSAYSFTGYDNIGAYLERLVPTFEGVTDVVLSGVSAGGFGAMLNFERVQTAFGEDVRVTLVDDSGPPMASDFVSACLQAHFRSVWGFDGGVLASCADCLASPDGSFVEPYFDHLMTLYPDRTFTVLSSDGDQVIRAFWGFGQNECRNLNDFLPPAYPASLYRQGLEDFRDDVAMGFDNVGLFMKTNSTRHVWLSPDPIWDITQDGVNLSTWLEAAIADSPTWVGHVPPGPQ